MTQVSVKALQGSLWSQEEMVAKRLAYMDNNYKELACTVMENVRSTVRLLRANDPGRDHAII